MPSFKIETVLTVLGPRYGLAEYSTVEDMFLEVTGEVLVDFPHGRFVNHVVKNNPQLLDYHENGRSIYIKKFGENQNKMIKHYKSVVGKTITVPVMRSITGHAFDSMAELNSFVDKHVLEQDVISVQTSARVSEAIPRNSIMLFYWE